MREGSNVVFLSYPLSPDTPTYAMNPPVEFVQESSFAEGDPATWMSFTTINHNGTHVDAPFHFDPDGRRIDEFTASEWVFEAPALIDIPSEEGRLIEVTDIEPHEGAIAAADLVLVRTGWAQHTRVSDPKRFGTRAPGFAASAADALTRLAPKMRALAMDLPSAASPVQGHANDEGMIFHRRMLGPEHRQPDRAVLLIEDVKLDAELPADRLVRVVVLPLRLSRADAGPATILAFVRS